MKAGPSSAFNRPVPEKRHSRMANFASSHCQSWVVCHSRLSFADAKTTPTQSADDLEFDCSDLAALEVNALEGCGWRRRGNVWDRADSDGDRMEISDGSLSTQQA